MSASIEKRLLQGIVAVACLVPVAAGTVGVIFGPGGPKGIPAEYSVDLDTQFRCFSGVMLGVGLGLASCIPNLEEKGDRFRTLGVLVMLGGMARLVSALVMGLPSVEHLVGFGLAVVLAPLLMLWQARVDRLSNAISVPRSQAPHPLFARKRASP